MRIQQIDLVSASQEKSLRQDFDYHRYHNSRAENYYPFSELFELLPVIPPIDGELDCDFQYCEIGDVNKDGSICPVTLNFSNRNLEEDNYYTKIERGDITHVSNNDILLSKVRPNLKKYVRITPDVENVLFTTAFIRIKSKQAPQIMYYCFRSVFYEDLMSIARQGKGYPTLNEKDLMALRFDKVLIDKLVKHSPEITNDILQIEAQIIALQKTIISEKTIIDDVFLREFSFDLSTFNSLQETRCNTVCNIMFSNNPDLRFSAKFHRKVGYYVMNQLTSVTNKKIKHFLSEPIILGASVSPSDFSDDGDFSYISMATIKNWSFDPESANLVSNSYSYEKQAKTVRKGDIILARSGEGTIGKVALIEDEEIQGIFADFTMRIRLNNYNPEFAYYYFRTTYFQCLIEVYKKGLGNNTNIFPVIVQEFPLLDISLYEQKRIVEEIHNAIKVQNTKKAKISKLKEQIDRIIERAIIS